jgi:hypothetical protein
MLAGKATGNGDRCSAEPVIRHPDDWVTMMTRAGEPERDSTCVAGSPETAATVRRLKYGDGKRFSLDGKIGFD